MSGRFSKTSAKPRCWASTPSSEPGSVMTREAAPPGGLRPRPTRGGCGSRWWSRTSTTRRGACAPAGTAPPTRAMRPGCVVSSTCSWGRPGRRREGAGQHLGEQARAAHAHEQHVVDARRRSVSTRSRSGVEDAAHTSPTTGIQPRRSAISVGSSCQSVWSPSNRRRTALGRRRARSPVLGDGLRIGTVMRPPAAASRAAAPIAVDHLVGVGQAREQHLVGAGGEGHAAVEHGVEEGGVARRVGPLRATRSRPGASAPKNRPTSDATCGHDRRDAGGRRTRRAGPPARRSAVRGERGVGARVEQVEGGEPGGGGERVPRQRAGLVHGTERGDLGHDVGAAAVGADVAGRRR